MHALLANVIQMSETEMKIQQKLHKYLLLGTNYWEMHDNILE
jgi:hypothetical protein